MNVEQKQNRRQQRRQKKEGAFLCMVDTATKVPHEAQNHTEERFRVKDCRVPN